MIVVFHRQVETKIMQKAKTEREFSLNSPDIGRLVWPKVGERLALHQSQPRPRPQPQPQTLSTPCGCSWCSAFSVGIFPFYL